MYTPLTQTACFGSHRTKLTPSTKRYSAKYLLASALLLSNIIALPTAQADCSLVNSTNPSNISFTNASSSPVTINWVDASCTEQVVAQLPVGGNLTKPSFISHVWRVRRSTDNTLLSETNILAAPANVSVTNPLSTAPGASAAIPLARDALSLPASADAALASPPNTPFVDPMPVPPVLTPVTSPNPAPTLGTNPMPTPSGRVVEAKLDGVTVATATIGGFTEATRPEHQKWTQFGGDPNGPGFSGDFYESVEMQVPWDFYPKQDGVPSSNVWTFVEASTGAIGPVRIKAQYGRPVVHRVHNALPADNGGFGVNQTSTHLHNGHTASESDGGPTHFYDAGHFKDFHYANARAGFAATIPTSTLNGKTVIGDVKETMSSLWLHDHRMDFTTQNVYKGLVSLYSLFSNDIALDTDDEKTGLRLPSGQYDVPMIFGDKSFNPFTGELTMDTTNIDGILGDKYTVNGKIQPYFSVAKRKYRFRLLNAGPSRYYEFFLSNGTQFKKITSNSGNLLASVLNASSIRLSPAERTDVIIDFTNVPAGSKIYLQNRLEQKDGRGPTGKIIAPINIVEFRVQPGTVVDNSVIPTRKMLDLPNKLAPVTATRSFDFGTSNGAWVVNGKFFDPNTTTIFPKLNAAEKWTFTSGGGWGHPAHIHMEEGQILSRNGRTALVAEDIGRKDVYRIGQGAIGTTSTSKMDVFIQFRDWTGDYPVHCHNVVHEDHAMMAHFVVTP